MRRSQISILLIISMFLNACTGGGKSGFVSGLSSTMSALTNLKSTKDSRSDISKKAYRTRVGMADDTRYQRLALMEAAVIVTARYRASATANALYNPKSPADQQRLAESLRLQALEYAKEKIELYQRFQAGPGDSPYRDTIDLVSTGIGILPYGDKVAPFTTFASYMENLAWKNSNPANAVINQYETQKSYLTQRALGIADSYLGTYDAAVEVSQSGVKSGELLFIEGWNTDLHISMPTEEGSVDKNMEAALKDVNGSKYSSNAETDSKVKKNINAVLGKVKNSDTSGTEEQFLSSMEQSYSFAVSQELEKIQKSISETDPVTRAQNQQIFEANMSTLERTGSIFSNLSILLGDSKTAQRIAGLTESISRMARAINEMKNIEMAMKAGELSEKVASSAKLAASAGMLNAVLGTAVFLNSLQDNGDDQQMKLWNEVFKQLQLIVDTLFQMRNEINEGFQRIERTQLRTMEMLNDLIEIVRFNTDVLLGVKYELSEVHDRLREQGVVLSRMSDTVDMTYRLAKLANERSIFINSIDTVNEKCLLNTSSISDSSVSDCFDRVYSILRNAISAVDDKPVLAATSKGRFEQFSGFYEDSIRALPLALKSQPGPNISYINQAYHLTISLLRKFSRSVVDEKYSSLKSVLKSQFEYLELFRNWIQKSGEFEKSIAVYDDSKKQLSSSVASLWKSTFQEVLQGNLNIDAETTGNFDEPYVDTSSVPICPALDEKGNALIGAENDDYERDIRPLAVLDSKVWAKYLPDEWKNAIFYKKGTLSACAYSVISNSTSVAVVRYGYDKAVQHEMFDADNAQCTQTYKTQVRFFWQDRETSLKREIFSVDLDKIGQYTFESNRGPFGRNSSNTNIASFYYHGFWTVPQNQLIRESYPPIVEEKYTINRQKITDRHSRVCSQWRHRMPDEKNHNFRFIQEQVYNNKSRVNLGLRQYFEQNKSKVKISFVKGYATSKLEDIVKKTNKVFAQRFRLGQGEFAQLEEMVYELGYRKAVSQTILSFAYGKTYAANKILRSYFGEELTSNKILLGVRAFESFVSDYLQDLPSVPKAKPKEAKVHSEDVFWEANAHTVFVVHDFGYREGEAIDEVFVSKGRCAEMEDLNDNSREPFNPNGPSPGRLFYHPDSYIGQVPRIMAKQCAGPAVQYEKFVVPEDKIDPAPKPFEKGDGKETFESKLTELALKNPTSIPSQFDSIGAGASGQLLELVKSRKDKWMARENSSKKVELMIELLDFEYQQNRKHR